MCQKKITFGIFFSFIGIFPSPVGHKFIAAFGPTLDQQQQKFIGQQQYSGTMCQRQIMIEKYQ